MTRNDPAVMRLAAEAQCDPRTALAALEGRAVRPLVAARLEAAARRLKVKLPKKEVR